MCFFSLCLEHFSYTYVRLDAYFIFRRNAELFVLFENFIILKNTTVVAMATLLSRAKDGRPITLMPAVSAMPIAAFRDALLKRRLVLAKLKASQLAEEAAANPAADDPHSAEAVA